MYICFLHFFMFVFAFYLLREKFCAFAPKPEKKEKEKEKEEQQRGTNRRCCFGCRVLLCPELSEDTGRLQRLLESSHCRK